MGLRLYPDSRERVTFVLAEDGAVFDANTPEAIAAYIESGDLAALVVPDDAVRFVVRPLTASGRAWSYRMAGGYPSREVDLIRRSQARAKVLVEEGSTADEAGALAVEEVGLSDDDVGAVTDYEQRLALWQVCAALESVSGLPDKPVTVAGVRRYPPEAVERLPMPARMELHAHVLRISAVPSEGKACSGSGSGPP